MDPDLSIKTATAVIAVAALFRPEVEKAVRRRASKLEIELTGYPEFGYNAWGPTISLIITLTSLHRAQYISKVTCRMLRRQDRSEYTLPWFVFRPPEAAITEGSISESTTIQVASPFLISPDEAVTKYITFQDQNTFSVIRNKLFRLFGDEWIKFATSKMGDTKFREQVTQANTSSTGIDINTTTNFC